jgi:hypothetical protein
MNWARNLFWSLHYIACSWISQRRFFHCCHDQFWSYLAYSTDWSPNVQLSLLRTIVFVLSVTHKATPKSVELVIQPSCKQAFILGQVTHSFVFPLIRVSTVLLLWWCVDILEANDLINRKKSKEGHWASISLHPTDHIIALITHRFISWDCSICRSSLALSVLPRFALFVSIGESKRANSWSAESLLFQMCQGPRVTYLWVSHVCSSWHFFHYSLGLRK